jgi:uncharacterized membrane protein
VSPGPHPGGETTETKALERAIAVLLRVGVAVSLGVVVVGTVVAFVQNPAYRRSAALRTRVIDGKTAFPHSIGALVSGLGAGHGDAIITLGLLLLLATPIARVAVSVATFAHERDRDFVCITGFVLLVLLVSFLLGRAGS